MRLASTSHRVMLLSHPPQSAWDTYQVSEDLRAATAIAEEAPAQQEPDLRNANPIGLTPPQKALQQAQFRADSLAQEEQEPVAWIHRKHYLLGHAENMPPAEKALAQGWEPLYTNPPRREWQSLSEGEVASCWAKGFEACKDQTIGDLRMHIARAVEAALKEKNHE